MSKPRIFLIHGWSGSPQRDWFPWATKELVRRGYDVITPSMPDTDTPVIETWVTYLSNLVGTLRSDDIFIGHSIGCQTILRYLESSNGKADKVILVAPWFTLTSLENEATWVVADPWIKTTMDFAHIKPKAKQFTTIFSDDDPWVPYAENLELFKEKLNPQIVTLTGKGHITAEEGSTQLVEILPLLESE